MMTVSQREGIRAKCMKVDTLLWSREHGMNTKEVAAFIPYKLKGYNTMQGII
jgi:hypothetical protein